MNIMVTGANGGYGKLALQHLLKLAPQDVKLFALVRKEEYAQAWREQGVEVRIGDYADADSMIKALQGIDRLLFVSVPTPNIQQNVVEAAKINGVKFIAYTSIFGVDGEKGGLEINHGQTEAWIRQSGIAHTFLRNNWYLEVHEELAKFAHKTGKFYHYAGDKPISGALKTDYAEAGAKVILSDFKREIINLTGKPYTYAEFAQALSEVYQQAFDVQDKSREEVEKWLDDENVTGVPRFIITTYQNITAKGNNGEEFADPSEFEEILGRKLPSLADALRTFLVQK